MAEVEIPVLHPEAWLTGALRKAQAKLRPGRNVEQLREAVRRIANLNLEVSNDRIYGWAHGSPYLFATLAVKADHPAVLDIGDRLFWATVLSTLELIEYYRARANAFEVHARNCTMALQGQQKFFRFDPNLLTELEVQEGQAE